MVDIETLDTVLAEQTDMTELVGDDAVSTAGCPASRRSGSITA
ncbi:hypothetical protein ACWGH7_20690 [Streptomyces cyaneofuscatus]|nr:MULTISPECIES: hypothetical protein [unclassified Streptomyces]